ncbi:hypothetical protein SK069_10860 [Patulibacter brassicae]|uniref:Zinc ribbon domain-containing protein n=1 Tax=Patulibacter brassicae TaxID=1705717 RepID=A0ABU4VJT9_9ACTN|nr:hypothetical protein [Patulibacter brassicae]MDX8152095.1 hypothetical protein [Patulibacter brassicae]
MATPVDPTRQCPTCATAIRGASDRFCGVCGTRLLRADLRAQGAAAAPAGSPTPSPPASLPPGVWTELPAPGPPPATRTGTTRATSETTWVVAALIVVALLGSALVGITVLLGGDDGAPEPSPLVLTRPATP